MFTGSKRSSVDKVYRHAVPRQDAERALPRPFAICRDEDDRFLSVAATPGAKATEVAKKS